MKKNITFVVNPISGARDKSTIKRYIDERIDKDIFEVHIMMTEYAGHATEIASQEREKGTDIVVAVGGDGTVNEIGKALVDSNTAMGIIPCGSGNGLARHLHIPMNVPKAIDIINGGNIQSIDYGRINNLPFFCTCGVGFDASISMDFAKKKTRGFVTYIETTLMDYLKYKPETYNITTENGEKSYKAFLITVGNASQYGNNAYIAPNASLMDGLFDVIVLTPFNVYDVPLLAYRLFTKQMEGDTHIIKFRCKHLIIKRTQPGSVHFDGEPYEMDSTIDIQMFPKCLKVVIPHFI
jgi:diacylglycerol kinase (ATP)